MTSHSKSTLNLVGQSSQVYERDIFAILMGPLTVHEKSYTSWRFVKNVLLNNMSREFSNLRSSMPEYLRRKRQTFYKRFEHLVGLFYHLSIYDTILTKLCHLLHFINIIFYILIYFLFLLFFIVIGK